MKKQKGQSAIDYAVLVAGVIGIVLLGANELNNMQVTVYKPVHEMVRGK